MRGLVFIAAAMTGSAILIVPDPFFHMFLLDFDGRMLVTAVAGVFPVIIISMTYKTIRSVLPVKTEKPGVIEGRRPPAVCGMTLSAVPAAGLVNIVSRASMTGYAVIHVTAAQPVVSGTSVSVCLNERPSGRTVYRCMLAADRFQHPLCLFNVSALMAEDAVLIAVDASLFMLLPDLCLRVFVAPVAGELFIIIVPMTEDAIGLVVFVKTEVLDMIEGRGPPLVRGVTLTAFLPVAPMGSIIRRLMACHAVVHVFPLKEGMVEFPRRFLHVLP